MLLTRKRIEEISKLLLDEFLKKEFAQFINSEEINREMNITAEKLKISEEEFNAYFQKRFGNLVAKMFT